MYLGACLPVTTHIPINALPLICVVCSDTPTTHIQLCTLQFMHTLTRSCSDTAAIVESLQCIQILQTYGADFGVKSVHGATPMNKAAAIGYAGSSVCLCTFDLWILVCDRAIPGHS